MYENMLSAMLQNKVYMVYCNFCFEYEDGRIEQMYPNTDNVYVRTSQDVQRDIIFEKVIQLVPNFLIRFFLILIAFL